MGVEQSSLKRSSISNDHPYLTTNESDLPRKRRKTDNGSASTEINAAGESDVCQLIIYVGFLNWLSETLPLLSRFACDLSDEQKSLTLRHMLEHSLTDPTQVTASAVVTVACEHNLKRKKRDLLILDLKQHSCIWSCIVRTSDAQEAGIIVNHNPPTLSHSKRTPYSARTHRRHQAVSSRLDIVADDEALWAESWPQIETEEFHKQVRAV